MSSSRDLRHDLELLVPDIVRRHLQWFVLVALAAALAAMALTLLPFGTEYGIVRNALITIAGMAGLSLAGSPLFHSAGNTKEPSRRLNHQALSRAYAIIAMALAAAVMALSLLSDLGLLPRVPLRTPDAPFFLALIIALASLPAFCRERLVRAR